MKRLAMFLFIAIFIAGSVFAQDRENRREPRQREINTVAVDGTLKLERGLVAVTSGDSVYYVPLLNRYINFIDGLKEGAKVSVEGNLFRNIIMPAKVTIEGKSYDFVSNIPRIRERLIERSGNQNHERRTPDRERSPARNRRGDPKACICGCELS